MRRVPVTYFYTKITPVNILLHGAYGNGRRALQIYHTTCE